MLETVLFILLTTSKNFFDIIFIYQKLCSKPSFNLKNATQFRSCVSTCFISFLLSANIDKTIVLKNWKKIERIENFEIFWLVQNLLKSEKFQKKFVFFTFLKFSNSSSWTYKPIFKYLAAFKTAFYGLTMSWIIRKKKFFEKFWNEG